MGSYSASFSGCIQQKLQQLEQKMGVSACNPCISPEDDSQIQANPNFLHDCLQKSPSFASIQSIDQAKVELVERGVYLLPKQNNGMIYEPKRGFYEGQIFEGKAHGIGKFIFLNSNEFDGTFKENQFRKGVLADKTSQTKFQGEWKQNLPIKGELLKINSQQPPILIQQIKQKESKSFYAHVKMPNKLQYQGQFVLKNKSYFIFEGKGIMEFPDGSSYNGEWFNGRFQGEGLYTWPNGNYYQGSYQNGQKSGWGKMYWKNDNKSFTGSWFKGQPDPTSKISMSSSSANEP